MAEYTYVYGNISLTSRISYVDFGAEVASVSGSHETILIDTSSLSLAAGEVIESARLTAGLNMSGSYPYTIKANGNAFYGGSVDLDVSEYTAGGSWSVEFYFCLDKVPLGEGAQGYESSTVNKVMNISNVQLTITTEQYDIQLPCPTGFAINRQAINLTGLQRDVPVLVSWDSVESSYLGGYELLIDYNNAGTFSKSHKFDKDTVSTILSSGSRGNHTTSIRIKALAATGSPGLDSELSAALSFTTKNTNIQYYKDGSWYLAEPALFHDDSWKRQLKGRYRHNFSWYQFGATPT